MRPRTDLVVENADGELIVLDKDGGEVHQLNQSATLIWGALADGMEIGEIARLLTDAFDVEQEMAISDVQTTIQRFSELGLLKE